jgi:hypothetical protein
VKFIKVGSSRCGWGNWGRNVSGYGGCVHCVGLRGSGKICKVGRGRMDRSTVGVLEVWKQSVGGI